MLEARRLGPGQQPSGYRLRRGIKQFKNGHEGREEIKAEF